jgi:hypothetical protein
MAEETCIGKWKAGKSLLELDVDVSKRWETKKKLFKGKDAAISHGETGKGRKAKRRDKGGMK